jgi:hypothetical protein
MKLTATIRPTETRTLQAEAGDYETAKAQIEAQVPRALDVGLCRCVWPLQTRAFRKLSAVNSPQNVI